MCLIILNQKGKSIPENVIYNAETKNPDGFGILYLDTLDIVKTDDYDIAKDLLNTKRPFACHYRYATVGEINEANMHPIEFSNSNNKYCLFTNGTYSGLGNKDISDTKELSNILSEIPSKYWLKVLSLSETRALIINLDTGNIIRHGDWHKKGKVLYSKSNCFGRKQNNIINWDNYNYKSNNYKSYTNSYKYKEYYNSAYDLESEYLDTSYDSGYDYDTCDSIYDWGDCKYVAVYGTLKSNKGNNYLLQDSEYIGKGETVDKYAMQCSNIPFLYKDIKKDHIRVEVYKVARKDIEFDLDSLEGHPDTYQREKVYILLDGHAEPLECWIYFYNYEPMPNLVYRKEF